MRKLFKKLWSNDRGNALIIAGAALPLLVGAAGLATDTIQWTLWKRQLQRAADSAALAGVESLVNAKTGICNMRVDARYSRFKCRIPAGAAWSYINGVEPADLQATGKR